MRLEPLDRSRCITPDLARAAGERLLRGFEQILSPPLTNRLATPSHGQFGKRAKTLCAPRRNGRRELDLSESLEQRVERNLDLQPGQRRSQAEVLSTPQGQVVVGVACDVEAVRLRSRFESARSRLNFAIA